MLIDRSHRRWIVATAILLAAATAAYVAYVANSPSGPQGGSVPGLLFGIAGSALMIYAGLLWVRKKFPRWQVGSAQTWLRGHIWLGSLSVPIILFHAGFHLGGTVERALWGVLGAIVLSGVFGLALQQFLPRDLTSRVPLETFYDQVPHVCRTLQLEADVLIAGLCGPLPVESLAVATKESLTRLDVAGRDPRRSVYLLPPEPAAEGHAAKIEAAGGKAASAGEKPPAVQSMDAKTEETTSPATGQKLSAAEKIAAMKAAKKVTTSSPPASGESAEPASAAATTAGDAPLQAANKPLSAAEKIAAMRAMKAAPKGPAAGASMPCEAASAESAPIQSATAQDKPAAAKGMTAAEKIAAMRAAKSGAQTAPGGPVPASVDAAAPPPGESSSVAAQPVVAKSMTASEKIAAMRAMKAEPKSPTTAETALAPEHSSQSKLTAADKIAAMRAAKAATTAPPSPARAGVAAGVATAKVAIVKSPKTSDAWKRSCPDLQKFYLDEVRPFLAPRYLRRSTLAGASSGTRVFATVKATLPAEMHAALARVAELCEERRQLATQVRIHHWLHGWELVHVPLTLALIVLGVLHAVTAVYF